MIDQYQILVVDDIEMNRDMLRKVLEGQYKVLQAENGKQAMQLLHDNEISLVLLDLSMPEMDGYEVIQAMKAEQKFASIPIVVETGAIDKSERRALDLGADDFIVKPYDPYVVRKRVDNLIRKYVLQVENLRQALGQAEQLNRSKSEFLSRMSHELRSPINSVISLATLQKEAVADQGKYVEYSDKIVSSARYLLGVINDVLSMSAMENEKLVITKTPFDFKKQIQTIVSMFYGQCKEKNIQFDLDLEDSVEEFLFGDPMRLKEILVNLISNAVKYTPEGGHIQVHINQLSRVDSMVKLRFEVTDDGIGIDKDMQELVFHPYMQEHTDTENKYGSSGLGLSIVRSLTTLMGGIVTLKSEKGKGSSFYVELPFTVSRELPQLDDTKLKKIRALMVDDEEDTQQYGKKMMGKLGIKCDIAFSGEEAIRKMRQAYHEGEGYDICFVDWRMPGMSGVEITKAIRDIFADDTVIVMASAYDLSEVEEVAKQAGANVVVPKPMFQSTVFDLLMNLTGKNMPKEKESVSKYNFQGKTALIAEDNTLNAEILNELLHMVGLQSERAANGKEVCDMFENSVEGTYDVILMDIQMPYMTGLEATEHIRASKHPQAKSIPILAVTANAFLNDVKKAMASGMQTLIAKPVDTDQLYAQLDKYIGQAKE